MSGRFTFPRSARLRRSSEFDRVYRHGRRLHEYPLRVRALKKDAGESRLGLSIGKKVGGTVVCNRWKRAIREAFRLQRGRLEAPHDLVVAIDWEADVEEAAKVAAAFERVIERLNEEAGGAQR